MTAYADFLSQLYPSDIPSGHHLLLWSRKPDPRTPGDSRKAEKRSWWCRNLSEAVTVLDRHVPHRDADWYVGCCLSPRALGAFARAKAAEVSVIPALWLDMDVADGVHKKKALPSTLDEALSLLMAMPRQPSCVVRTGGGLQAWWFLREPCMIVDPSATDAVPVACATLAPNEITRADAQALEQCWNERLLALAKQRGWTTDSVFDLARVMRLPGAYNVKLGIGQNARPTEVLLQNDERFTPEDLRVQPHPLRETNADPMRGEECAGGVLRPSGSSGGQCPIGEGNVRPGAAGETSGGYQGGSEENGERGQEQPCQLAGAELREAVDAAIDNLCTFPRFEATWDLRRSDFADNSLSSYDAALAAMAVCAGVPDEIIMGVITAFRLRHGTTQEERDKGNRRDYLLRTVQTAHQMREESIRRAGDTIHSRAAEKDTQRQAAKAEREEKLREKRAAREDKMAAREEEKERRRIERRELGLAPSGPRPTAKTRGRSSAIDRILQEYLAAETGDPSKAAKERLLDAVSQSMGASIQGLICYRAEPSSYTLLIENEEVNLGPLEILYNYNKMMLKVADASGIFLPPKMDGWNSIVRAIHAVREVRQVGEDGTDQGVLEGIVRSYLESQRVLATEDVARALERQAPFVWGGSLYITIDALRESSRDLQALSKKAVAAELVKWGAEPKVIGYARPDGDAIVRTTTRAYLLPQQEAWKRYIGKRGEEPRPSAATSSVL